MISSIKLSNFRNFKSKNFEFSDKITTIVGPNASGKTNILEALYLLSTGKSFKARTEVEMIQYGSELASVEGSHFAKATRDDRSLLKVIITNKINGWPGKRVLLNNVPKRLVDFAGNFKTVLFGPWDMDLVTDSPSLRRKFLDTVLSQTDREYRRSILSYEKGIRQRNKLLWRIREDPSLHSGREGLLLFWNQLLIKNGNYISQKREELITFVNNTNDHQLQSVHAGAMNTNYQLEYDRSTISEGRLEQYSKEEVMAATTLVGPHRDDMQFKINNSKFKIERNLAAFGSRGEQRMGVLWLKLAELDYIELQSKNEGPETSSGRPTLLLDDIFSELDHEHRDVVMELAKRQQTVITTADEHFLNKGKFGGKIEL